MAVGRYISPHITPTNKREARLYERFATTDNSVPSGDLQDAKFVPRKVVLTTCGPRVYSLWPKEIIKYFS